MSTVTAIPDALQTGDNANIHSSSYAAYPGSPSLTIVAADQDAVHLALDAFCNSHLPGNTAQFRAVFAGSGDPVYAEFPSVNLNGTVQSFHRGADSGPLAEDTYTVSLEYKTNAAGFYCRPATAASGEWLSLGGLQVGA